MKQMDLRHATRKWFQDGLSREASHLIVLYSISSGEYYPSFVFPEQDVEFEVVKALYYDDMLMAVMTLSDDMDYQISSLPMPYNMVISRVEN